MSERIRINHESDPSNDLLESLKQNPESNSEIIDESPEKKSEKLKNLTEKVKTEAKSRESIEKKVKHEQDQDKGYSHHSSAEHRDYSANQAIKRVQKHLPKTQRAFSKIVHNPVVESVSEVTGATVARPTGLLWGGVFAFISSLGLYIITKYYGYEYSFFVGILFFGLGFIFGLIIELITKIIKIKK